MAMLVPSTHDPDTGAPLPTPRMGRLAPLTDWGPIFALAVFAAVAASKGWWVVVILTIIAMLQTRQLVISREIRDELRSF